MEFECSKCHKIYPIDTLEANCSCGGLFNLKYKKEKFDLNKIKKNDWSIFRYINFMANKEEDQIVSLGEGLSPIVKLNDNVLLKMDYFMPTLSFKDRGAAALISHVKSIGVKKVIQDSSGNAGNSVAAYCARANIQCEIFVPEGTSPQKINMIKAHGAKINIIPGSRDNCADAARKKVKEEKIYYANHVYNPFFYEGTKTYIYETYEELGRIPENILVPVGNGTLFLGIIYGLEDLLFSGIIEKFPNIIGVQSENCDPLLQARKRNMDSYYEVKPKKTFAEGIAIGQPKRDEEILRLAKKYKVKFIHAREDKILEARHFLAKNGIYCEHTSAANYAGYLNYIETFGPLKEVLIPMCGAGLKSDH